MVFADTSGLIAAFDHRDPSHAAGRKAWRLLSAGRQRILLTEFVVAETVTLLRRRGGWAVSREVGEAIRTSRVMEVVALDQEACSAAWREFVRNPDPKLSFCDAASFVTMRERGIGEAFTLDRHFREAGFRTIP